MRATGPPLWWVVQSCASTSGSGQFQSRCDEESDIVPAKVDRGDSGTTSVDLVHVLVVTVPIILRTILQPISVFEEEVKLTLECAQLKLKLLCQFLSTQTHAPHQTERRFSS